MLKFAYYRYYCTDYNQILHSRKDHQILFVGGPNTRKTNPRWRTAAILRSRKSAISPEWFDRSSRNLARWLRLPATKKWRARPNVKILVLCHPLGDLCVTCTVHLWLAGKRVVDFLSVIIELFWLSLTAAALLCEICWNRRFLKGWFTLSANFRKIGTTPAIRIWTVR